MKTKVTIFLSLLFIANIINGQEKYGVKGIVKCSDNKEVLSGVTVLVESLNVGTSTDKNGFYELFLPQGSYTIRFSFVGYISETKTINVTNSFNELNISLKIDNKMLDAVVVSSTRKDANITELKMSVQTIDMVRVRKIPSLMGEIDVIKSIQLLPGVHAASEGSSGFSVRGGSARKSVV